MEGLLADLQILNDLQFHGFVSGYVSKRNRVPWYTILTTVLALVGAIESARLLIYDFLEAPDVLITSGRAGAINYFPEQQLFESFKVTSRVPAEQHVVVKKVSFSRQGGDEVQVAYEPHVIKDLREDQSETIQTSIPLPAQVGLYELRATTETKAGWLKGSRTQSYSVPVKVWSPVPSATFLRWLRANGSVGTALYRLEVGYIAPSGLDCTAAVIGSPPDVVAIIPRMVGAHGATDLASVGEGNARVVSQRWTTRPFADFSATTVPVVFQASEPVQWESLPKQRIQLNCSPHATDVLADGAQPR